MKIEFVSVFDDEDEHIITTGAVVTLTVRLERENMASASNRDLSMNQSATMNNTTEEQDAPNDDDGEEKENREKVRRGC